MAVSPGRRGHWFLTPLSIDPHQHARAEAEHPSSPVNQRAVRRHREVRGARELGDDALEHRHWIAAHLKAAEVESDRAQGSVGCVDEVTSFGIAGIAAAFDQNLLLASAQIEDSDLKRFLWPAAGARADNRKQNCPAAGE